tara:strand:+ start:1466 stop:1678 length:213 start_codon:yes stop_codon:yes gene_type:complete
MQSRRHGRAFLFGLIVGSALYLFGVLAQSFVDWNFPVWNISQWNEASRAAWLGFLLWFLFIRWVYMRVKW